MDLPKLIMLYGGIGDNLNKKQQMMIDGQCTCGYREYARKYGVIIYMTPQNCKLSWENSLTANEAVRFCNDHPKSIVWSVKHDPLKDEKIISKIKNKKVYYSCCNRNMINDICDISLVDTTERLKLSKKAKLHIKGKDPNYWLPINFSEKIYDYVLVGKRADKNEIYFLNRLKEEVKDVRTVLWIGGEAHRNKVPRCHHSINLLPFVGQDMVRDNISLGKIGILFTEHPAEGFPQTFLEMSMCGLPVIYNCDAPMNSKYIGDYNIRLIDKPGLVSAAESMLFRMNQDISNKCRTDAINRYSIEISYKNICQQLGVI